MTPEQTRRAIKVMEHYASGGGVECRPIMYGLRHPPAWTEKPPEWDWGCYEYRIKHEPREFYLVPNTPMARFFVLDDPAKGIPPDAIKVREVIE